MSDKDTPDMDLDILGPIGSIYLLTKYLIKANKGVTDICLVISHILTVLGLMAFQIMVIIALLGVYKDQCGGNLCYNNRKGLETMVGAVGLYGWLYVISSVTSRKHAGDKESCVQGPLLYFVDFTYNAVIDIFIMFLTLLFCFQFADTPFSLLETIVAVTFVCEIDECVISSIFSRKDYKVYAAESEPADDWGWIMTRRYARFICWCVTLSAFIGCVYWMTQVMDSADNCSCYECCADNPVCTENDDCWDSKGWDGDTGYCPKGGFFAEKANSACDWALTSGGTCSNGGPSTKTRCTEFVENYYKCFATLGRKPHALTTLDLNTGEQQCAFDSDPFDGCLNNFTVYEPGSRCWVNA